MPHILGNLHRITLGHRRRPLASGRRHPGNKLGMEALENRRLLAAMALGEINGTVFVDNNRDGDVSVGETISGATVQLYRDANSNKTLDVADALVSTETSVASGDFQFSELAGDDYFVLQPAQKVNGAALVEQVSGLIEVDRNGTVGRVIDSFRTSTGPTADAYPPGSIAKESHLAAEALGGQRDFEVNLKSGIPGDTVEIRAHGGALFVNPDFNAIGNYQTQWDGIDSPADGLDARGLGGVDLTQVNGVSGIGAGIELTGVEFDHPGGIIRLWVYTSDTQFSEATITSITPFLPHDFLIPFEGSLKSLYFEQAGPNGGADFTNVGAVELEIEATQQAMDGQISIIGVIGRDSHTIEFANPAPVPGIDIEKFTNGVQADRAQGSDVPQIPTGSTVTWTYQVTNTGEANLNNVTVEDDALGAVTDLVNRKVGDQDNVLEPGEVWAYQATGTAIEGAYENRGTVKAVSDTGETVADADLSHYFGYTAAIDVEKSTNGVDADVPGTGPEVLVGESVTFTYTVRNLGNVVLSNVQLEDDNGTPAVAADDFFADFSDGDADGDARLDVTETWTFEATRLAALGDYQNVGRVTARAPSGDEVSDTDPSNHRGLAPPPPPVQEALPLRLTKRSFLASSYRR